MTLYGNVSISDFVSGGGGEVSTFSGGPTGLTPDTPSTGNIVLGGVLEVAYGGTGAGTTNGAYESLVSGIPTQSIALDGNEYMVIDSSGTYIQIPTSDIQSALSFSNLSATQLSNLGVSVTDSGVISTPTSVQQFNYNDNIVENSTFADGLNGWVIDLPAGIAYGTNSNQGSTPTNFLYCNPPNGTYTSDYLPVAHQIIAVYPGVSYSLQSEMFSEPLGNTHCYIRTIIFFYDSSGNLIPDSNPTGVQTNTSSAVWTQFLCDATHNGPAYGIGPIVAPANAALAHIQVDVATNDGSNLVFNVTSSNLSLGWALIKFESGDVCTQWSDNVVNQLSASIQTEATTRANAVSSLASQFTTLQSNFNSLSSTVSTNYTTLSSANATNASAITTLQSDYAAVSGNLATLTSTVNTNYSTQSSAISTNASAITTLTSNYNSLNTTVSNLSSTVSTNYTTLSNATSTNASAITTLQSNYGSLSATVSSQAGTLVTLDGKTDAWLSETTSVNGASASVLLNANGVTGSNIELIAGILSVLNNSNGTALPALTVSNGNVSVANTLYIGQYAWIYNGNLYFDNGSVRLIFGEPFGASTNLLLWGGASGTAIGSCTTGNAGVYITTTPAFGGNGISNTSSGGTLQNTGSAINFSNAGYTVAAKCQFSNITAGSYWTFSTASIYDAVVGSNSLSSGLTGTINWRICESPHGSTSYTAISGLSGSFTTNYIGGEGMSFPANSGSSYYTFINELIQVACVNSGAVDLTLQFQMSTAVTLSNIQGTVGATATKGG